MCTWSNSKPPKWATYLSKFVNVSTHSSQYKGWVFTVDPVSASIVLVTFPDASPPRVQVVLGHQVASVEVLQDDGSHGNASRLASVFSSSGGGGGVALVTPEELQQRRASMRRWIERHHIPVTEDGELLRVAGVLTISAPYGAEDCSSSNEIILSRVQSLLHSNPELK
ncbi:gem-associated protein 6 [Engraulis encrasicolus]|uniref:gem-associated protein 6 n=1 Tax=Engraulis encrasicolus TaxID=184585 RepID=UPI002FD41EA4